MIPVEKLSPADAAIMETFVVPRYLKLFGDLALEMLLAGDGIRVAHLGCRTGYPDREIFERHPGATVIGVDPSAEALELARNKVAMLGELPIEYHQGSELPTELPSDTFSHALCLHPVATVEERGTLFGELARILYPGGQALIGLPLRGSFQELADLFREYALKTDEGEFGKAVEEATATRPTIETLSDELETVGLDDVDVEIRSTELSFDSGRAFVEDPISRLLILPELRASLGVEEMQAPLDYLRDAIDKYWSEGKFELTLNVGCASARKV